MTTSNNILSISSMIPDKLSQLTENRTYFPKGTDDMTAIVVDASSEEINV